MRRLVSDRLHALYEQQQKLIFLYVDTCEKLANIKQEIRDEKQRLRDGRRCTQTPAQSHDAGASSSAAFGASTPRKSKPRSTTRKATSSSRSKHGAGRTAGK